MDFSPELIRFAITSLIILVLSIGVHEFGHAWVADKLGDPLPRSQGRVTLNPIAHADPIGTLAFPLFGYLSGAPVPGWGRPVQIQPHRLSKRFTMDTGHMMVAAAGPLMNLLFGTFIAVVHIVLIKAEVLPFVGLGRFANINGLAALSQGLALAVFINFMLMMFNLIPMSPLDGGTVLRGLLPSKGRVVYDKVAVYGPFIVIAFMLAPGLGLVIQGPARFLWNTLYSASGLL